MRRQTTGAFLILVTCILWSCDRGPSDAELQLTGDWYLDLSGVSEMHANRMNEESANWLGALQGFEMRVSFEEDGALVARAGHEGASRNARGSWEVLDVSPGRVKVLIELEGESAEYDARFAPDLLELRDSTQALIFER